jgi:hypothetical protein
MRRESLRRHAKHIEEEIFLLAASAMQRTRRIARRTTLRSVLGQELRNPLAAIVSALGAMNHIMRDDSRAARPREVMAAARSRAPNR